MGTLKYLPAAALLLCASIGCASAPTRLPIIEPDEALGVAHPIIVATSRAVQTDPLVPFGAARAEELSCREIDVWTPKERKPGTVRLPSRKPKINRQFAATRLDSIECGSLTTALNERLQTPEIEEKSVIVFVHGFNTDFAEGVYHQAQFIEDFQLGGVAVHYSWPSAGRLLRYLYDRDSAEFARDGLVRLLTDAAASNAEDVTVIAHSMGALLAMEAVRQLELSGRSDVVLRISPLILASPDIDTDVFRAQLSSLAVPPDPLVIFVSSRDKALKISQRLRGGSPRVGEGTNIDELRLLGVTVIDISLVTDADRPNHSAFARSPTVIKMVRDGQVTMNSIKNADDRTARKSPLGAAVDLIAGVLYYPMKPQQAQ